MWLCDSELWSLVIPYFAILTIYALILPTVGATQLILLKLPVSVTLGLFDDVFIVDPSSKEDEVIRGKITCATAEDGTVCFINQVLKVTHLSS